MYVSNFDTGILTLYVDFNALAPKTKTDLSQAFWHKIFGLFIER